MANLLQKGDEARQSLIKGVNTVADMVTITLGPTGRNVAIDKRWSSPSVVHDGVSVAKAIELKDPFENMGAQLIKEASSKTADVAGDGTTTAMLLAQAMVNDGARVVSYGTNPMKLRRGIQKAVRAVVSEVKKTAKPISSTAETEQIATISAADPEIGKMIAEAIEKVTREGVISVEDNVKSITEVEYKEGMQFDKGLNTSSKMFYTNPDKQICEIEDCYVLFTDMVISNPNEIATFLGEVVKEKKSNNILVIADSVEGQALATLIINVGRGALKAAAVTAPAFAERRKAMLEDMAVLTGGQVLLRESQTELDKASTDILGKVDKVWISDDETRLIGGHGDPVAIKARVNVIKDQMAKETSEFQKEKFRERLAKLTGGAAVIKVGATTEGELKDKKERIIDAVAATKAALEEGVVAGGGIALLEMTHVILDLIPTLKNDEEVAGAKLVMFALNKPFSKLLENAGLDFPRHLEKGEGIDVETGEVVNMIDSGIIDPAKVTRQAIESAASVAATILTTEGAITEIPEDKKSPLEAGQIQQLS